MFRMQQITVVEQMSEENPLIDDCECEECDEEELEVIEEENE